LPETIQRDAVYTHRESADRLRISERHLRKLVKAGTLHPLGYAVGKHLFLGSDLIRVAESRAAA
jgi:predicted site-specific integrase-resolvase